MTRRRSIRDVQVNRRGDALCARELLRIQLLLRLSLNFAMLAEDGREGEAKEKERMHAALIGGCSVRDLERTGLSLVRHHERVHRGSQASTRIRRGTNTG